MVFVSDFKREFYDLVINQRILVLASLDVDALCACRILQYLFQSDHVLYTIIPINSKQDLEKTCIESFESVQYILLLNCGASLDIVEILQPPQNIVFFICDSHRPIDVHNIYNQVQVKLLIKEEEIDNIPVFNDIFREEDDTSNDDDSDDENGPNSKKHRFDEEALDRRRNHRIWDEKKMKILFEYSEFTYYGTSASLLIYELSWKLSKETNDLLWLAIIGVTDQFISNRIDRDFYIDSISLLQPHVSRLNQKPTSEETSTSIDCLRISFNQEPRLVMHRHWSLMESIQHTQYTACKFVVWSLKGKKRLHEFLADMGLPLVQCRQKFQCMDSTFRESLNEVISKHSVKYGIDEQELFLPTFHAQYGYKNKFCASDVARASQAYLNSADSKSDSLSDNFLLALDSLNRSKNKELLDGIDLAKLQIKTLVSQVQTFLDMNQIISAGPFLYTFVQQGSPDAHIFTRPNCLAQLASFTLEAYCSTVQNKKTRKLPLIVGTYLQELKGSMLLVGISPLLDRSMKNCFGKAFEQAAINSNSRTLQEYFDTHVIELKLDDKSKFFDNLISLLQD